MTNHHETIEDLSDKILQTFPDSRSALIYAPNTVGKTRLTQHLKENDPEGVLLYNSFVEDVFTWDNERFLLKVNPTSELLETIATQGLDGAIIDNFRNFTNNKIEPRLDLANGEVSFEMHTGNESLADYIKISRAEESIFIWSVYYTILSDAIDTLKDSPDLRLTSSYDQITLVVIDDPVSSMDDVRIVSVALAVERLIKKAKNLGLKFVLTTHHALFFNVLHNALQRIDRKKNLSYVLQRGTEVGWVLKNQRNDTPFSYHLGMIEEIQRAISENTIDRGHFNQFRALLEKTANFLGHTGGWGKLLTQPDADLLIKALNLYSHDRFADIEAVEIAEEYKDAFKSEFSKFLEKFRWAAAT